ncbi:MAG: helix-turn-helix domain-containing protein [Terriglobales bacterium]
MSQPKTASTGPFRFERDMFASLSELLPEKIISTPDRWVHLREPTVGNVIPDLLFGEWSEELRPLKRNFTFIEARILALLEQRDELLESEISQLLHLSAPAAARAFKRIQGSGLVLPTRDGKISLDAGCFTRALFLTAVELKLRRWREALDQAINYLKFADRAYVVLDGDQIARDEEMIKAFRTYGVGLLMLRTDGLSEVVSARAQSCISPQRIQAVQKICIRLTESGRLQPSMGLPCLESV